MTRNEVIQSGQEKNLLARQNSSPDEPNSKNVWNDVSQRLPPSRVLLTLSTFTEKLHYQHNSFLK